MCQVPIKWAKANSERVVVMPTKFEHECYIVESLSMSGVPWDESRQPFLESFSIQTVFEKCSSLSLPHNAHREADLRKSKVTEKSRPRYVFESATYFYSTRFHSTRRGRKREPVVFVRTDYAHQTIIVCHRFWHSLSCAFWYDERRNDVYFLVWAQASEKVTSHRHTHTHIHEIIYFTSDAWDKLRQFACHRIWGFKYMCKVRK